MMTTRQLLQRHLRSATYRLDENLGGDWRVESDGVDALHVFCPRAGSSSSGSGCPDAVWWWQPAKGYCGRATRVGTDGRAAPARAVGSRATHPDSAVDSPSERRGRIQCVHGVVRRDRPRGGSACARSMRAGVSRRAGSGRWRASGFAPGARPTSVGSSRSCHSPVTFDHLRGASARGRTRSPEPPPRRGATASGGPALSRLAVKLTPQPLRPPSSIRRLGLDERSRLG